VTKSKFDNIYGLPPLLWPDGLAAATDSCSAGKVAWCSCTAKSAKSALRRCAARCSAASVVIGIDPICAHPGKRFGKGTMCTIEDVVETLTSSNHRDGNHYHHQTTRGRTCAG